MYRVYATNQDGDGRVITLGDYADPTEIEIIVGMFSKDVIITIEEVEDGHNQ